MGRGLPSRDDADITAAANVGDDEEPSESVYAESETASLEGVFVIAGCSQRVREHRCCVGEIDAVFPKVGHRLRGVPFVLHAAIICTCVHRPQEAWQRGLTVRLSGERSESA